MEPVAHFGLGRGSRPSNVAVNFVDGTVREFLPEINTMYTVTHGGAVDVVFSRPDAEPPSTQATPPGQTATDYVYSNSKLERIFLTFNFLEVFEHVLEYVLTFR